MTVPQNEKASNAGFQYIHHRITGDCHLPAQQRAAFTLESRGVITEPVLHFTETVDKGLFIALFQQGDRFAKTLIIALDQRRYFQTT